jgi:transposase
MRTLEIKPHLDKESLLKKMHSQQDVRLFQYWQILFCIQSNPRKKASEYADLLGVDISKIYRIVELYNREGAGFDRQMQWGGRREQRSKLSIEQEARLLKRLEVKAGSGKIITMNNIRQAVEREAGSGVSDDYLWDLFKRHGWRKKAPRPQHPKKDSTAQEGFKKNSPSYWMPVQKD